MNATKLTIQMQEIVIIGFAMDLTRVKQSTTAHK